MERVFLLLVCVLILFTACTKSLNNNSSESNSETSQVSNFTQKNEKIETNIESIFLHIYQNTYSLDLTNDVLNTIEDSKSITEPLPEDIGAQEIGEITILTEGQDNEKTIGKLFIENNNIYIQHIDNKSNAIMLLTSLTNDDTNQEDAVDILNSIYGFSD